MASRLVLLKHPICSQWMAKDTQPHERAENLRSNFSPAIQLVDGDRAAFIRRAKRLRTLQRRR